MTLHIAFLRAINVGGHNVKMDELRRLFEALNFANVETFIASGNVIFETQTHDAQTLERRLQASLGYEVATFIRSAAEVAKIAEYEPFSPTELETEGNTLYVAFLPGPATDPGRERLMALRNEVDDFYVHRSEAYWLRRRSVGESKFSGAVPEKTMGIPATVRNANTVRRLAAKYAVSDAGGA